MPIRENGPSRGVHRQNVPLFGPPSESPVPSSAATEFSDERDSLTEKRATLPSRRTLVIPDQSRHRPSAPLPEGPPAVRAVRERRNDGSPPPPSSPLEGRARSRPLRIRVIGVSAPAARASHRR